MVLMKASHLNLDGQSECIVEAHVKSIEPETLTEKASARTGWNGCTTQNHGFFAHVYNAVSLQADSFAQANDILGEPIWKQYILGIYWAAQSLSTVG